MLKAVACYKPFALRAFATPGGPNKITWNIMLAMLG